LREKGGRYASQGLFVLVGLFGISTVFLIKELFGLGTTRISLNKAVFGILGTFVETVDIKILEHIIYPGLAILKILFEFVLTTVLHAL
jgi:hypothetical protein